MRAPVFVVLALVALLLPPLVPADTRTGSAYGFDLGYFHAGSWSTFWYGKDQPGDAVITLTWARGVLPSDYDLLVYAPGAMDDGFLGEQPIYQSSTRTFAVRSEQIVVPDLPLTTFNNEYVIAIIPHQAQGETFTLSVSPGYLVKNQGPVIGVRDDCAYEDCPFFL